LDIQLKGYKYAPQLHVNLFSITKALDQDWMISNKGVIIILSKGRAKLQFDKIFTTNSGKVIGVELLARQPNINNNDTAFTGTDSSDSNAPQDPD
jgi:3-deoxy-D-manno-octulosonate 8-phosphate phosphatase KdsC-like HAD superfamily phosphatase